MPVPKKDQEKDQEKEVLPDWLSDFKKKAIKASAEVNIKPKLTIDALGIENCKDVIILSIPSLVKIPKDKAITSENIFMMDLLYNNIAHQFTCQAGSFRFQLGVLKEKLEYENYSDLLGLDIKIWKELNEIETPTFKGKAVMYHIALNE